jgi:hypothetical protein
MNSEASPQVSRTGAEAILAADLVTGAESILAVRILSGRGYIARRNGVRERVELSVHVRAFVHVNTTRWFTGSLLLSVSPARQGCRETYVRKLLANRFAAMTSTVCET